MIFTAVKFVAGGLAGIGAGAVATKAFRAVAANVMPDNSRFMNAAITLGGIGVGLAVSDLTTKAIEESVNALQTSVSEIKTVGKTVRDNVKKETSKNG